MVKRIPIVLYLMLAMHSDVYGVELGPDGTSCQTDHDCMCLSGSGVPFIGCSNRSYAPTSFAGGYECDNCQCKNNTCIPIKEGPFAASSFAIKYARREVHLRKEEKDVTVKQESLEAMANQLEHIFGTCWLNSRDHPQYFKSDADSHVQWENTMKGSHIYISYAQPVELQKGLTVSEILFGFPGTELTRHNDEVISYIKCDGSSWLKLICMEELRQFSPEGLIKNCHSVDSSQK